MSFTCDARGVFEIDPETGKRASASRFQPVDVLTRYSENFNSPTLPDEWVAYNGATISINTDTAQNYNASAGSLKAVFPLPAGEVYVVGNYDMTEFCALGATNHVYIKFKAKMPGSKQGLKFIKIFGVDLGNGVANCTFGLDYTGDERGGIVYIGFGDGSEGDGAPYNNDTANGIWLDGSNGTVTYGHGPGRSEGLPGYSVSTPQNTKWLASNWGTTWHDFEMHIKFNSGTTAENEVNDGELDLIIDGVTYAVGRGLFNRHYLNGPIGSIHAMDYAQTGTEAFELWMDDLKISQNGWPV